MDYRDTIKAIPSIAAKASHVCVWQRKGGQSGVEIQLFPNKGAELNRDDINVLKDVFQTDKVEYRVSEAGQSVWITLNAP